MAHEGGKVVGPLTEYIGPCETIEVVCWNERFTWAGTQLWKRTWDIGVWRWNGRNQAIASAVERKCRKYWRSNFASVWSAEIRKLSNLCVCGRLWNHNILSAKEATDRTCLRLCPNQGAWIRLRYFEGVREWRWLCSVTFTDCSW
jgi:hypothetical protein